MEKQNKSEWGNIELPGLTDEELFTTDWNHLDAVKARSASKEYQEKLTKYLSSDHYKKSRKEWSQRAKTDKQYKKRRRQGIDNFLNDPDRYNEWRKNLEAAKDRIIRAKYKPMQTPDGIFESLKAAAAHYGIHVSSMRDRMKHNPDKYYYIKTT